MAVSDFKDLLTHVGHKVVVVTYGDPPVNVAVECEDCCEVLVDFDREEPKALKIYDVHFQLNGFIKVEANNEEEARQVVNDIINDRIDNIERVLHTGLKDDDYTTDVIETD